MMPATPESPSTSSDPPSSNKPRQKLSLRRILTKNVLLVFLAHGLLNLHVGTFNSTFYTFMSTPRYTPTSPAPVLSPSSTSTIPTNPIQVLNTTSTPQDPNASLHLPSNYQPRLPFIFTGGLALDPTRVGFTSAILGIIGILTQFFLYPRLSARLGTVLSFQVAAWLFPLAYSLTPFLALVRSASPAPAPADGWRVWAALVGVLLVQVLGRTFAIPATTILVNNASPHPSVLGTVHGIGQSVSSAMKTVGPVAISWMYAEGLSMGFVALAWWCMAGMAVVGAVALCWVREGDGHEIWLEGDEEEAEVKARAKAEAKAEEDEEVEEAKAKVKQEGSEAKARMGGRDQGLIETAQKSQNFWVKSGLEITR